MLPPRSYDRLKTQQVAWARARGIDARQTEAKRPWVLRPEYRALNFWKPGWWSHIAGKEHRWARALTSSQCFAVNLFAPLAADPALACKVLLRLRPSRALATGDIVEVVLEFTPPQAPEWLGESRQATQVDAAFIVRRQNRPIGYLLFEVKLGERRFGTCRGAKKPTSYSVGNPRAERCRSLAQVLTDPQRQCWLAEIEGRNYWRYLRDPGGPLRFDRLAPDAPCPFSGGLYQLMRNYVLAQALVRDGGAEWADFALCIHPANETVGVLEEPVAGTSSAHVAFTSLLGRSEGFLELEPKAIIEATVDAFPALVTWGDWMRDRYRV
jgi:hypothetical protein